MSSFTTPTPLSFQAFKLLQKAPEGDSTLPNNYGTIDLKAIKQDALTLDKLILGFSLDRSGSMEIISKDGNSLLQHAQTVVINIARYLMDVNTKNPNTSFAIKVVYFDNQLDELPLFKINFENETDNIDDFIRNFKQYKPRGSTNIQLPIEHFKNNELFQEENSYHILLTDGKPNCGHTSSTDLQDSLPNCNNIFIGFGPDHAVKLLTSLAKTTDGEYNFVNSAENAGMLYGDLLHGILYNVSSDINVIMKGGQLYNYKTKSWDSKLNFKKFSTEHTQTLVFKFPWDSVEPQLFEINYTDYQDNKLSHNFSSTQDGMTYNPTNGECKEEYRDKHVEKHMYRVKTMEYLACMKNYTHGSIIGVALVNEIESFKEELDKFIKRNNYEDDLFMLNLQKDIQLCLTSSKQYSNPAIGAFLQSRLSTHGRQGGFAVDVDDLINNEVHAVIGSLRGFSAPNAVLQTTPPTSLRQSSAYTTPSQTVLMRACSQQPIN
jgi:hypothetical protein